MLFALNHLLTAPLVQVDVLQMFKKKKKKVVGRKGKIQEERCWGGVGRKGFW